VREEKRRAEAEAREEALKAQLEELEEAFDSEREKCRMESRIVEATRESLVKAQRDLQEERREREELQRKVASSTALQVQSIDAVHHSLAQLETEKTRETKKLQEERDDALSRLSEVQRGLVTVRSQLAAQRKKFSHALFLTPLHHILKRVSRTQIKKHFERWVRYSKMTELVSHLEGKHDEELRENEAAYKAEKESALRALLSKQRRVQAEALQHARLKNEARVKEIETMAQNEMIGAMERMKASHLKNVSDAVSEERKRVEIEFEKIREQDKKLLEAKFKTLREEDRARFESVHAKSRTESLEKERRKIAIKMLDRVETRFKRRRVLNAWSCWVTMCESETERDAQRQNAVKWMVERSKRYRRRALLQEVVSVWYRDVLCSHRMKDMENNIREECEKSTKQRLDEAERVSSDAIRDQRKKHENDMQQLQQDFDSKIKDMTDRTNQSRRDSIASLERQHAQLLAGAKRESAMLRVAMAQQLEAVKQEHASVVCLFFVCLFLCAFNTHT